MRIAKKPALAVLSLLLLACSAAFAQEHQAWERSEVSIQGKVFFTKDSQGNGISQDATDAGGFLVGYRYHFDRRLAADRNTQQNLTAGGPFVFRF